ncbi:3-keto-steroid reductase [Apiospora rasikravindrae]|uniref:3-keto-steroid reductase n=1 Tax=Apiospora rasikravindrae TaxID=990691 RepID=A0ABR1TF26_9PEZI
MAAAPWAGVPSNEQFFVLLTGANSGVGQGICQRLIDDFLATRSLAAHLVLIPTTRSPQKSRETIESLRAYLAKAARTSTKLRSRAGPDYDPESAVGRVHLLAVEVDLCKLPSIYDAAAKLLGGQVRDPTGVVAGGQDLKIPKLDAVLFNAGYGGWDGIHWFEFARQFFTVGLVQSTTFPSFKSSQAGHTLPLQEVPGNKPDDEDGAGQPRLAEVFCANTFGHYILAHELMPLLTRSDPSEPAARVVFTSSIDAEERHLDLDDFQGFKSTAAYESSKRVTDLMCLTSELPSVQAVSSSFFFSGTSSSRKYIKKPRLLHPLFPLNAFMFFFYYYAMLFSRLLGSPWHGVDPYIGACATVWLALEDETALDANHAQRVKWGSAADRHGRADPKKTEVEGWGWEGKVEDAEALKRDEASGVLRKLTGRKWDAVELTEEKRSKFEEDGVRCWKELEALRVRWEEIMGRRPNSAEKDGQA